MKEMEVSIRAFFPNGNTCTHRVTIAPKDIGKWMEAYTFTHPEVVSITVKWWNAEKQQEE